MKDKFFRIWEFVYVITMLLPFLFEGLNISCKNTFLPEAYATLIFIEFISIFGFIIFFED